MNDVTFVINIILGKNETEYELATADVNGDGYINMNDVTAIINIILGKTSGEDEEDDGTPPVGDDDANPGRLCSCQKSDYLSAGKLLPTMWGVQSVISMGSALTWASSAVIRAVTTQALACWGLSRSKMKLPML